MELVTLPDAGAVARRAADEVAAVLRARPAARVLLPAGATPVALYAELVTRVRAGAVDLGRAELFQLDEVVGRGPEDPASFARFLRARLLDALAPRAGGDHLLDGAAPDPAAEIAAHAEKLAAAGGADLALLGLGRNGHVAFNEPGSAPDTGARVAALAPESRAALGDPPTAAGMTLGLREILGARRAVVLVTGGEKAAVLARLKCSRPDGSLPASHVLARPGTLVLADASASAAP